jgi:hypothetical protein
MRREASRVSFLMCPFCVRALSSVLATRSLKHPSDARTAEPATAGYDPELPATATISPKSDSPETGYDSCPGFVVDTSRQESHVISKITSVMTRPTIGSPTGAPRATMIALATTPRETKPSV